MLFRSNITREIHSAPDTHTGPAASDCQRFTRTAPGGFAWNGLSGDIIIEIAPDIVCKARDCSLVGIIPVGIIPAGIITIYFPLPFPSDRSRMPARWPGIRPRRRVWRAPLASFVRRRAEGVKVPQESRTLDNSFQLPPAVPQSVLRERASS